MSATADYMADRFVDYWLAWRASNIESFQKYLESFDLIGECEGQISFFQHWDMGIQGTQSQYHVMDFTDGSIAIKRAGIDQQWVTGMGELTDD